jgi:hypothetical protein
MRCLFSLCVSSSLSFSSSSSPSSPSWLVFENFRYFVPSALIPRLFLLFLLLVLLFLLLFLLLYLATSPSSSSFISPSQSRSPSLRDAPVFGAIWRVPHRQALVVCSNPGRVCGVISF